MSKRDFKKTLSRYEYYFNQALLQEYVWFQMLAAEHLQIFEKFPLSSTQACESQ